MDIEQLKLILDMIREVGDTGGDMFIWWLVADKAIPAVLWALALSGFFILGVLLLRVMSADALPARLRDAMGVGSPGSLTTDEIRDMYKWISEKKKAT